MRITRQFQIVVEDQLVTEVLEVVPEGRSGDPLRQTYDG